MRRFVVEKIILQKVNYIRFIYREDIAYQSNSFLLDIIIAGSRRLLPVGNQLFLKAYVTYKETTGPIK